MSDPNSEVCLADVVEFIVDNRGRTAPTEECGIPLISTNCVSNEHLYPLKDKLRYVSQETYENWFRSHPIPGDILLTNKGSQNGAICLVPDPVDFCIAQDMVALRADRNKIYPLYLFAVLRSRVVQNRIKELNVDAVIPHFKKTDFNKLYFPLLGDREQKFIGDLYFKLSYKIELNHQINQTLEEIAQTIFKSWFVNFDPVKAKISAIEAGEDAEGVIRAAMRSISGKTDKELVQLQAEHPENYTDLKTTAELFPAAMQDSELGEIPEGWKVKTIQDLAKIIKGKSYKSAELEESKTALVTLKSFNRGGGYRIDGLKEYTGSYKTEQEVFAGDLIIAYTDVTQTADVVGKPAMVVSDSRYQHLVISLDVAVVRPEIDDHRYFLYCLAMTDTFQNHTKSYTAGTTVLHLGASAVPDFQFPKPSEELLKFYGQKVSSMFTLINGNIEESRSVERLRDTLLSKLLSGELSIEAAEFTEEN